MTLAYVIYLGFKVQKTNIGIYKINRFSLETYGILIIAFQVFDKLDCFCFFQETFLFAKISLEVVFNILFLTFSNADVQFTKKKLT